MRFIIEESNEVLTPFAGLPLVDSLINKTRLVPRLNATALPHRPDPTISNGDIAKAYLGLLCQGKSDFDNIETFRTDSAFHISLGLKNVPSTATLRQRLDFAAGSASWEVILEEETVRLLQVMKVPLKPIILGSGEDIHYYVPLDVDVSPFDNSGTKKEGVSYTYKGFNGYAPIFAYLGQEGYGLGVRLRPGSTHSQTGAPEFLTETIRNGQRVTMVRLLVRLDSGNDSANNIRVCREEGADFIIKRNLRREKPEAWLAVAQEAVANGKGTVSHPRPGKEVYRGSLETTVKGLDAPVRMVYEVVKRTILGNGQELLIPDIEVQTFWTSLPNDPAVIHELYKEHGTMEQFHSEIKTDLDMERLPSGKLATNNLVLHLALFAYNLLRVIGQESMKEDDTPLRKARQRRRVRTVIQNLITMAAHLTKHARRCYLRLGMGNRWATALRRLYQAFA